MAARYIVHGAGQTSFLNPFCGKLVFSLPAINPAARPLFSTAVFEPQFPRNSPTQRADDRYAALTGKGKNARCLRPRGVPIIFRGRLYRSRSSAWPGGGRRKWLMAVTAQKKATGEKKFCPPFVSPPMVVCRVAKWAISSPKSRFWVIFWSFGQ